jgi:hypothetical protein
VVKIVPLQLGGEGPIVYLYIAQLHTMGNNKPYKGSNGDKPKKLSLIIQKVIFYKANTAI